MAGIQEFGPQVIGALLGISERRVQQLRAQRFIPEGSSPGMYPLVGSVQGYIRYLQEHGRASGRGNEHARLARAQAIKVEMDNLRRAGQSVNHAHVLELLTNLATEMNSAHEGLAGNLCNELANITDPAAVRQRLQDELRRIRSRLADRIQQFAETCERRADDLENAAATTAQDTESVGGREQDISAGVA
jgi:hypothetical protein